MPFLLSLFLFTSLYAQEFDEDALFQKAFKRKTTNNVSLPVFFEGQMKGSVSLRLRNNSKIVSLNGSQLYFILKNELKEEVREKLKKKDGLISPKELEGLGITLILDQRNLVISTNIEASSRYLQTQDIAFNQIPEWAKKARYASGLSGFVNTFNYYRKDTSINSESVTSDQNINLNLGNFAFLGQTSWQRDNDESEFFRQDMRLTYDDTKNLVRYQVGDLNYSVNQFQVYQPGVGFMASTNFDLDPYRLFNPMTFREITLNTPSRVRVFVNGVLVQTLNLPVGRHRLDNLPLNEGINNVRLEIQDNRGRREDIQFKGTTSFNLISSGIHDFTYGGGIPAKNQFGDREYDKEDKKYFGILNHLYGLNDQTNIGYGINFNSKQRLGTFQFLRQSLLGYTNLNLSYSELLKPSNGVEGAGFGARLTHAFRDYGNPDVSRRLRTFDIAFEYLGPEFTAMDTLAFDSSSSLNSEVGYTQFVTDNFNYRLRGGYRTYSRDSNRNSFNGSVGLTYLWQRNYQVTAQYSHSQFTDGSRDDQVLLSFNFTAPQTGQAYSASYNTSTKELNAGANYTGRGRPSNLLAQANVRTSETGEQYEAEIGQQAQWYTGSFNWLERSPSGESSSRLQTANFNTAFTFAGGAFSVSRPINQSFALVTTGDALKGEDIYLNRYGDQYEAKSTPVGAVLPAYQAYRYYPIRIDSTELPMGIQQPPQQVAIKAPFRGGVRLHFAYPRTYAFIGKILYKNKPLNLKTGELVSSDNELAIYPFFTNRSGRFLIENLPKGDYQVFVEGKKLANVTVTEPKNGFFKWEYRYE